VGVAAAVVRPKRVCSQLLLLLLLYLIAGKSFEKVLVLVVVVVGLVVAAAAAATPLAGRELRLKNVWLPRLKLLWLVWLLLPVVLLTQLLLWSMVVGGPTGWWVADWRVTPGFVVSGKKDNYLIVLD
jgi:hypothetical protein